MKRYQLFLAYYTLITTFALLIWSIFYAPKPQGFLLTVLVIPISIYFWLLISGASKRPSGSESENQNHGRSVKFPMIVLLTLFVSFFSIFAYSTISNRSFNSEAISASTSKQISSLKLEMSNQNKAFREEIVKELEGIKNQLANIKTAQKVTEDATIMGDTTQVGTITISDKKYPTVNVYAEKSLTSKIVGKAEFGKRYTFIEKDQDWYLILLGAKEGLINSQFVKEVQY